VYQHRIQGLSYDAQIQPQIAHTDDDITSRLPSDDVILPKAGNLTRFPVNDDVI